MAARKIFDIVRTRRNQFGTYYNARFAPKVDSIPDLESMAKAVGKELGKDVSLRARNDGQVDRNQRVWIDLYPRTENVFAKAKEAADAQS